MREARIRSLGWEDLLEKEMATHSSTLAWKVPWTEEPSVHGVTKSRTQLSDFTSSLHSCIAGYSKQILISFYFINYLILSLNISYFLINFLLFLAYLQLKDRAKNFSFLKARHLGIFPKKV